MSYLSIVRRLTDPSVSEAPKLAKKAKEVPATRCVECGDLIGRAEPECWWGRDRVHLPCGKAAWARAWTGEVLPADAVAEGR